MITKQVKDLQVGDDLGNCIVLSRPQFISNYCGSKNRASINVRFADGKESTRIWGWATTVKVKV
jgi:hypothetical protein